MKIELDQLPANLRITAYTDTSITVAGSEYQTSIIINNESVIDKTLPASIQDLGPQHLAEVIAMAPEIVLFGTGAGIIHPQDAVTRLLFENYIGMEIMDTGAACRSFNFLLGESRKIVALLFIGS